MDFVNYIRAELLILIPVLYFIGMAIKHSEWIDDKRIPLILGGIGIALGAAYLVCLPIGIGVGEALLTGAIQGVLCAGAAVYTNQLIVQAKKDE